MEKANQDIKKALEKSGVRQWELAEWFGYTPSWYSVKLRHEFSSEEKLKAFTAIQEIKEQRTEAYLESLNAKSKEELIAMITNR